MDVLTIAAVNVLTPDPDPDSFMKSGDINEGDIISFGSDPMKWVASDIKIVNGKIVAFQVTQWNAQIVGI